MADGSCKRKGQIIGICVSTLKHDSGEDAETRLKRVLQTILRSLTLS